MIVATAVIGARWGRMAFGAGLRGGAMSKQPCRTGNGPVCSLVVCTRWLMTRRMVVHEEAKAFVRRDSQWPGYLERWKWGRFPETRVRWLGSGSKGEKNLQDGGKTTPPANAAPLHENIYNIPNILTFSRLLSAPLIGYLILHDAHTWSLALFAYAGVTDLVDGYIARRWKLQTVVGTVIDPMADKTLMTVLTVCLAVKGGLPIWLASIILGRDIGLGIAAIYYRYISLPPPKTFSRYWDFSLPSAEVHPTAISKINTFLQLALIGACTAQPLIPTISTIDISAAMSAMQYLVATTTIWSGASYIYNKDAVKILPHGKK